MIEDFSFKREWLEVVKDLPEGVRKDVIDSVIMYAFGMGVPELKPTAKIYFTVIKTSIDAKRRKSKRFQALANKRWNPEFDANADAYASAYAEEKEETPTEKVTQKELPEEEKEQEKDIDKSISKKKFVKPTEEEVAAYCKERHNNISATQFMAYYESNGWKVGRDSMKDWKAAIRYWEQTRKEKKPSYSVSRTDSRVPLPKSFENYYEPGGFEV